MENYVPEIQALRGPELEMGCQLTQMHPCPPGSHYFVDPGATFLGCLPQVMNILLLDMKAIRDDPIILLSLWDRSASNSSDMGQSARLTPKWLVMMNHVPIL